MRKVPDIKNLHIDDTKEILDKKNIKVKDIIKKISFGTKKDYVIKTVPENYLNDKEKLTIYISKFRILPILLFIMLFLLGFFSMKSYFMSKAPKIEAEDQENFQEQQVIEVVEDAQIPGEEIEYYLYCISKDNDMSKCEWKRTDTKNIEIKESGVWYVWFKGVSKGGNESKVSEVEEVKVDNDSPIINSLKASATINSIKIKVNASDNLSGNLTYYYSIDGGKYVKDSDIHVFENLKEDTWYKIKVKIVDAAGNEYVIDTKVKTLSKEEKKLEEEGKEESNEIELIPPKIDLVDVPSIILEGDDYSLPSHVEFDDLGGTYTCKDELDNVIDSTKSLVYGSHTISCSANGNNGLTSTTIKNVEVETIGEDEVFDGWIRLNLYYPVGSTQREWRTSNQEYVRTGDGSTNWQAYTGPILVRIDQVNSVYIKYVLNGKTEIIPPAGELVVDIEPDSFEVKENEVTTVRILYDENASEKKYRINGGAWLDYNGEFEVGPNTLIDAKVSKNEAVYDNSGNYMFDKTISSDDSVYINKYSDPNTGEGESNPPGTTGGTYIPGGPGTNKPVDTPVNLTLQINPESSKIRENETTNVSITYEEDASLKLYRVNDGDWQIYSGEFAVGPNSLIEAIVTKEVTTTSGQTRVANKSAYAYVGKLSDSTDPEGGQTPEEQDPQMPKLSLYIVSDSSSIREWETTKVNIYYDEEADTKLYRINGENWMYYSGEIEVGPNTLVEAMAAKTENNKTITNSKSLYVNLYEDGISSNPPTGPVSPKSTKRYSTSVNIIADNTLLKSNETTNVNIYYDEEAEVKEFRINGGSWQEYDGTFEVGANTQIEAIATKKVVLDSGSIQNVTKTDSEYVGKYAAKAPILKTTTLEGPTIISSTTSKAKSVEISIETEYPARNIYYSLDNGLNYELYKDPFELRENKTIKAYYIRDEDGKKSSVSSYRVQNISNGPSLNIEYNPDFLLEDVYLTTATIKGSDYVGNIEYSFDGVVYKKYENPLIIKQSTYLYAKAKDENNKETIIKEMVSLKTPPRAKQTLEVKISVDREKPMDESLVNKIKVNIYYDNASSERYYKINDGEWKNYSGEFVIDENATIYAFAKNSLGDEGYDQLLIDYLYTGQAKPIFEVTPEETSSKKVVKIIYDKNSIIKEYSLDGINYQEYSEPFEVNENITIYARGYDIFDEEVTSTYTIDNMVKLPKGQVIDKGKYLLINLNYPSNAKEKEYKYLEDGEWKIYPETGIMLILPQYKDEFDSTADYYEVKDASDNKIRINKEHVYVLTSLSSEVFDNLFMRWDNLPPDAPEFIQMVDTPCKENRVFINYDLTSVLKEYKLIYPDGSESEWQEYITGIKIDKNNTTILARSKNEVELYSETSYHTVTNIDDIAPTINVLGDTINPTRKVVLKINVIDNGIVDYISINNVPILNNSDYEIEENATYTIYARDSVGNETTKEIVINNIDKNAPNIEIRTNNIKPEGQLLGKEVDVDIYYDSDSIEKKYSFDNTNWINYEGVFTLKANDMAKYKLDDGSFIIYAYAKDGANNETSVQKKVFDLDLLIPSNPTVNVVNSYPKLTKNGVVKESNITIEYDSNYDLDNYYCIGDCTNENSWKIYKGAFEIDISVVEVQAKSIKKESKVEVSNTKQIPILNDELQAEAYDNNNDTKDSLSSKHKLVVDKSSLNYLLKVLFEGNLKVCYQDKSGSELTCDIRNGDKREATYIMPSDTKYITFENGSVYEVSLTDKPILINSPAISISDEGYWTTSKNISIIYPSNSYTNEYSLDKGNTWNTYTTPFEVDDQTTIFARSLSNGKYISSSSYYVNNVDNTVPTITITKDTITPNEALPVSYTYNENKGATIKCYVNGEEKPLSTKLAIGTYDLSCTIETKAGVSATDSKTLYVKEYVTVTFNANGGSCTKSSMQVEKGQYIDPIPTCTKTGTDFIGFYTASSGGTQVSGATKINGNQTLYAQYGVKSNQLPLGAKVNYCITGNQGQICNWTVIKAGSEPQLVATTTAPSGYSLSGKAGYENATKYLRQQASSYLKDTTIIKAVRLIGDNGQKDYCQASDSSCVSDSLYSTDTNLVKSVIGNLKANTPSGTAVRYWLPSRTNNGGARCIRFIDNYGSIGSCTGNGAGNTISWSNNSWINAYTKTNYIRPIITIRSVSNLRYTNVNGVYNIIKTKDDNDVKYTVEFNANNGEGTMETMNFVITESKPLLENQFTRDGYQFLGWSKSSTATVATYTDKQTVSRIGDDGQTVTLYAVWAKIVNTSALTLGAKVNYCITGNQGQICNWTVIKTGSEPQLVATTTAPSGYSLSGKDGYENATKYLRQQASSYLKDTTIIKAVRLIGDNGQKDYCQASDSKCVSDSLYSTDTNLVKSVIGDLKANTPSGTTVKYWLPSRTNNGGARCIRFIDTYGSIGSCTGNGAGNTISWSNNSWINAYTKTNYIRPIITFNSSALVYNNDGTYIIYN